MSEQDQPAIALEMALHKAVDQQLDTIVQAAVRVACLLENGTMRQNQLRNVLNTALNTESLELLANFIRYQIGRSSAWQQKNFGEELIAALHQNGAVGQAAVRAVQDKRVIAVLGEQATTDEIRHRAHIILARRFLGELNRAFAYADARGGWQNLKPILETQSKPALATPIAQEG